MWWKFEDIETIHDVNAKKDVPYKDFLLSNVDWSEWPGGAAEIEASQIYFKNRVAELEDREERIRRAIKATHGGAQLACDLLGSALYIEITKPKG